jgi:hypothetical protein
MSATNRRSLSAISDADLVRLSSGVIGSVTSSDALGELYRRYSQGLYAHCMKLYGKELAGSDEVKAFVGRVFLRFQKYADRFNPDIARCPEEIPKLIRCWLAKQACWAIGEYRVESENQEAGRANIDPAELASNPRPQRPSRRFLLNLRKLRHVLRGWHEKDRDIIMTSIRHLDPDTGKFHVPDAEQERLRSAWGFASSNSLVKYRSRRLEDLRTTMLLDVA